MWLCHHYFLVTLENRKDSFSSMTIEKYNTEFPFKRLYCRTKIIHKRFWLWMAKMAKSWSDLNSDFLPNFTCSPFISWSNAIELWASRYSFVMFFFTIKSRMILWSFHFLKFSLLEFKWIRFRYVEKSIRGSLPTKRLILCQNLTNSSR